MKGLVRAAFLFVTIIIRIHSIKAQAIDPTFRPAEVYRAGEVRTVVRQADGRMVVYGQFSLANGMPVRNIARYNADGSLDADFNERVPDLLSHDMQTVRPMPDGRLLVVSPMLVSKGSNQVTYLAMLRENGELDPDFIRPINLGPGYFDRVQAIAITPDNKIILGGLFKIDGVNRYLVRLNPNGSVDASFPKYTTSQIVAPLGLESILVQPDGKILVGGSFTTFNGTPANGLVRLLPDGTRDAAFATTQALEVYDMVLQPDGRILIGGLIDVNRTGFDGFLARLLPNGATDPTFTVAATSVSPPKMVRNYLDGGAIVLQPNGKIIVVFGEDNPYYPNDELLRFNSDGSPDTPIQLIPRAGGRIATILMQPNGQLLIAGRFNSFNGRAGSLVQVQLNGEPVGGVGPSVQEPGHIEKMVVQADGKIVVGGEFVQINGTSAGNLARLEANGDVDTLFTKQCTTDFFVTNLVLQPDQKILACGQFTYVGRQARQTIVRLQTSGAVDPSFKVAMSGSGRVTSMAVQTDGRIVLAGGFVHTNGQSYIMRVEPDGKPDATFYAYTPSVVLHVMLDPSGKILATGYVSSYYNRTIKRFLPSSADDPSFTQIPVDDRCEPILQPDGKIIAAVLYTDGVKRFLSDGTVDPSFSAKMLASSVARITNVRSIALQPNGRLLLSGNYDYLSYQEPFLERLLINGAQDASFSQAILPDDQTLCIQLQPDGKVLLGGNFQNVGPYVTQALARIIIPGIVTKTTVPQTASATKVWPVPTRGELNIELDAQANPQRVSLYNALGQVVRTQLVSKVGFTLNTATLPTGTYLLQVEYANGPVMRRVVIE
jgi:uncharacterized delta-60 repeat protein